MVVAMTAVAVAVAVATDVAVAVAFRFNIVQSLVRSPKRTHCVKLRQFPTVGRKAVHLAL